MKNKAIIILGVILLMGNNLPAEDNTSENTENNLKKNFLFGFKLNNTYMWKRVSPVIPIDGPGAGIGLGFYSEIVTLQYLSFETGLYLRTFSVGALMGGELTLNEYMIPLIGKFRIPVQDNFAMSMGAGYCYFRQFSGTLYNTVADADPIELPGQDLADDFNFIIVMGFQVFTEKGVINFDLGFEEADRSLRINEKDFFLNFGAGIFIF